MDVKSRLREFLKYKNLGQKAFEAHCGLANGYVNNIRRSITPSKLQQIALRFPDLNTGWLITGEGEMLKGSASLAVYTGNVTGNGNNFVTGSHNHINTAPIENAEFVETAKRTIMLDLKMLAFDKGLGQKEVGEILGIAQSQVSAMMTGKRVIRLEHIAKLYDRFGKECVDSYIVQEMPTLPYQATATIIPRNVAEDIRREARKEVVSEVEQAEEVEIKETVILTPEILTQEGIDIKKELKAGTLEAEVKPTQDVLPPHQAQVYTETDEMSPEVEANDPVFVKFLTNKRDFIDGRMYFVDLDNASVVRWVVGEDSDHIRIISMKDEKVIPFDRVRSIAEVVVITKRPKTLPKHRITMEDVIAHKDSQIDMVNSQIDTMLEQQSRLIGIIEGQLKKE